MSAMTGLERRAVTVLAGIYALRIFGLFLILPVFALYATDLRGHSAFLVGLAIGVYGLTQALLQIPFGALSDRFGRKPIIVIGLIVFAIGSVIAARADSIAGVIVGRAIQGAGAIPAAVMALLADLTRDEQRTKAMAFIGSIIGAAFILSIVISPVLDGAIGVRGIFWLTAVLAVCAIAVLLLWVPTPTRIGERSRFLRELPRIVRDTALLRLNLGIFVLHLALTAVFVVLPALVVQTTGLASAQHWQLYLPNMLAALLTMIPFVIVAHKKQMTRRVMLGAIATLIAAQAILLSEHRHLAGLIVGLWLFFSAFNLLEAMLPSLVSRLAPAASKGAAIGVYSTAQFLGAFTGGAASGALLGAFGVQAVFVLVIVALALWGWAAYGMTEPQSARTHVLRLSPTHTQETDELARVLAGLPGVQEAVVIADEGIAYIKVDPDRFDVQNLQRFGA